MLSRPVLFVLIVISLCQLVSCGKKEASPISPNTQDTVKMLTDFSPKYGEVSTIVTLYGKYLLKDSTGLKVYFLDALAEIILRSNDSIQVKVPAKSKGLYTIGIVTNKDTLAYGSQFEITEKAKKLTFFSPKSGEAGAIISLYGQYILKDSTGLKVYFLDALAEIILRSNDSIQVKVPAKSKGLYTIGIVTNKDTLAYTNQFEITERIKTLSYFDPKTGYPGTNVVLHGQYLLKDSSGLKVMFNQLQAEITLKSDDSIIVKVPAQATNNCTIRLKTNNGTLTYNESYIVMEKIKRLTYFSPTSGETGTNVVLYGQNLLMDSSGFKVLFNDIQANIIYRSDDSLIVKVPNVYMGDYTITVSSNTGSLTYNGTFALIKKNSLDNFRKMKSFNISVTNLNVIMHKHGWYQYGPDGNSYDNYDTLFDYSLNINNRELIYNPDSSKGNLIVFYKNYNDLRRYKIMKLLIDSANHIILSFEIYYSDFSFYQGGGVSTDEIREGQGISVNNLNYSYTDDKLITYSSGSDLTEKIKQVNYNYSNDYYGGSGKSGDYKDIIKFIGVTDQTVLTFTLSQ